MKALAIDERDGAIIVEPTPGDDLFARADMLGELSRHTGLKFRIWANDYYYMECPPKDPRRV